MGRGSDKKSGPHPPFPRIGSEFFSPGGRSSLFHSLFDIFPISFTLCSLFFSPSLSVRTPTTKSLFHSLFNHQSCFHPHLLFHSLFTSTTPLPFSFSFFLYMYQRYSIHSIGHANLHLFPFFFLFLRLHFHISSRVLLFFYWLFRGTD